MARRRRDLVYLDRSKVLKSLQDSEWGRARLAETEPKIRPGMTRLEEVDWALDRMWQITVRAAATVQMPGIARTIEGLEVAFLPREEVAASCESFPDGSGLVLVSDALITLARRLAAFNSLWRGPSGLRSRLGRAHKVRVAQERPNEIAESPEVTAAVAALRYTTQHIRAWGLSAGLGLRKEECGFRDGALAPVFVLAHEIGHFVLGHGGEGDARSTAEREFEADEFALRAMLGRVVPDRVGVGSAVIVALCAMQVWESAALLRDVRAHPPALDRWQAIADVLGAAATELSEGHTFAARVMSAGAAMPGSLSVRYWDSLRADDRFEIVHGLSYLKLHQGFDNTESQSLEQRDELISTLAEASPAFIEGWRTFLADGWEPSFDAWGIDPQALLDPGRAVSYWQVVSQIVAAPVWADTNDIGRRACALLAIHARAGELKAIVKG